MPRTPLPPMTSRQAKKLHKKVPVQPYFTPSQIRALDRKEEQEKKRLQSLEAERKRKSNKRKREEKDEKEREAKRQQVEEGKLPIEALWGKVTSSQPRLNIFLARTITRDNSETPSRSDDGDFRINDDATTKTKSMENGHAKRRKADDTISRCNDEIVIAEDETAEPLDQNNITEGADLVNDLPVASSPAKSVRSVLSPMSQADVNIRAQQRPDTTSTPQRNCGLHSPEKAPPTLSQSVAETMAMISTQDFADEDDEVENKENDDPTTSPKKALPQKSALAKPVENSALCTKTKASPGFGEFSDCEDLFDFDDDDNDDEFLSEGLDDETMLSLVATQKPRSDFVIDKKGSPKKVSPVRDGFQKVFDLVVSPSKSMRPPMGKPVSRTPSKTTRIQSRNRYLSESISFGSIADDDLLELASQLEADSAKKATTSKRKRRLPWQENPLPPPSTQELMLELVEEYEADLE